ncbi:TPA: hypothetical protein U5E27_003364 [Yersinia enterocolitica]|nr:hypothetical protein [Yersinia enterocolitica]
MNVQAAKDKENTHSGHLISGDILTAITSYFYRKNVCPKVSLANCTAELRWAIVTPQRQNPLSGLEPRKLPKRTTVDTAIMCGHSDTCNMQETVNWVGASQDAPGSLVTGSSNLAQFTTHKEIGTSRW